MDQLRFKKLHPSAVIPSYATPGSAGMDVSFCADEFAQLRSNERGSFSTGLAVEIPEGYELQCRPRSGLAAKHGLMVVNSPGTIDSDYRGEIKVILLNTGSSRITIAPGDRIAQLVLAKTPKLEIVEVFGDIGQTVRGEGGFGSTGV